MLYFHETLAETLLWRRALEFLARGPDGALSLDWEAALRLRPSIAHGNALPCWAWTLSGAICTEHLRRSILRRGTIGVPCRAWVLATPEQLGVESVLGESSMIVGRARDGGGLPAVWLPLGGVSGAIAGLTQGERAARGLFVRRRAGSDSCQYSWRLLDRRPDIEIDYIGVGVELVDYESEDMNEVLADSLDTSGRFHAAWAGPKLGGLPGYGQTNMPPRELFVGQITSCPRSEDRGIRIMDMGGCWLLSGNRAQSHA